MSQNFENNCQSNDFPGWLEFSQASEGPQNVGKKTRMDILVYRDINGRLRQIFLLWINKGPRSHLVHIPNQS